MACALASPPSKRCSPARPALRGVEGAVLALLILLALSAGSALAAGRPRRTILLFPIESHWLSAPLARQVTAALAEQLGKQNLSVIVFDPSSPACRDALADTDVPATSMRHDLALAAGAQASLIGTLTESGEEVILELDLAGAVSHRSAPVVGARVREGAATEGVGLSDAAAKEIAAVAGAGVAGAVVAAFINDLWPEIGADEAGQVAGAAERYNDGQAALAAGDYARAAREFEAAVVGDPGRAEHFAAAAEAQVGLGSFDGALIRMRHARRLAPGAKETILRHGDIALLAGKPDEAESAFRAAAEADPGDLRALEGMARAARAAGRFDRAVGYYTALIKELTPLLPRTGSEAPGPASAELPADLAPLPRLLAGAPDDTIRLTSVPADELGRPLGMLYLGAGRFTEGLNSLLAYQSKGSRPPWPDADYLSLAPALDDYSRTIARDVQSASAASALGQMDVEHTASRIESLHTVSSELAALAEQIQVSPGLDPAHRFRVLAYNLLNESNFEAAFHVRTQDAEHGRRADLLRDAFRSSLEQAQELAAALLGGEASR